MPDDRPNILLLMTDQQQAAAMSCAGNPDLHTPAMDRLAAEGLRCTNTYTTFPLCVPARSSLFTGQMPSTIGAMSNDVGISDEHLPECLGNVLTAGGYTTGYAGKWHAKPIEMQPQFGFEKLSGFDDTLVAGVCDEFLRRQHNQPFCLVASFDNPHNICEHGRDQNLPWGPVPECDPADYPNLPPNYAIPAFEPDAIDYASRDMPRIASRGRLTQEDWRRFRHGYFRLCEKVDAQLGRILDSLDAAGLTDDTLVIFTSDHGDHAGAHQLGQKTFLYEEAVHVPLLVRWPGHIDPGSTREQLIAMNLDLYATAVDVAGVTPPAELPGASLRPLFDSAEVDWRDQVVSQTNIIQSSEPNHARGRMLRTARYKYVLYDWGRYREQLFDLETDPGELVNLAVEGRYAGILQEHRERLHGWMLENGDSIASGTRKYGATGVPGRYGEEVRG